MCFTKCKMTTPKILVTCCLCDTLVKYTTCGNWREATSKDRYARLVSFVSIRRSHSCRRVYSLLLWLSWYWVSFMLLNPNQNTITICMCTWNEFTSFCLQQLLLPFCWYTMLQQCSVRSLYMLANFCVWNCWHNCCCWLISARYSLIVLKVPLTAKRSVSCRLICSECGLQCCCRCRLVIGDGESFGEVRDSSSLFDDTVVILSQDQLRQVCPASWSLLLCLLSLFMQKLVLLLQGCMYNLVLPKVQPSQTA